MPRIKKPKLANIKIISRWTNNLRELLQKVDDAKRQRKIQILIVCTHIRSYN